MPKKKDSSVPIIPIPHYVCTGGCKVVKNEPGKCPSSGCPRARNPLTKCECINGKHGDLFYLNASKISR